MAEKSKTEKAVPEFSPNFPYAQMPELDALKKAAFFVVPVLGLLAIMALRKK